MMFIPCCVILYMSAWELRDDFDLRREFDCGRELCGALPPFFTDGKQAKGTMLCFISISHRKYMTG